MSPKLKGSIIGIVVIVIALGLTVLVSVVLPQFAWWEDLGTRLFWTLVGLVVFFWGGSLHARLKKNNKLLKEIRDELKMARLKIDHTI